MKKASELIAPCHFGVEAVLKRETIDLGYETSLVENGKVTSVEDDEAIYRASIFLRTAERVFLKVGSFRAESSEELFQGAKTIAWKEYIPQGGKFWVTKASSIRDRLFNPSDIRSIMKKAMVERVKKVYGPERFPETGSSYPLRVFLYKDIMTIGINTSRDSLHKRGYRTLTSKAPIVEILATALILLTPWNKDRILVDPSYGSGTFPIEAAMMTASMAPGMKRTFLSEGWRNLIPRKYWYEAMGETNEMVDDTMEVDIQGCGIDGEIVKTTRASAGAAEVGHMIHFQQRPLSTLGHPRKYGFLITNPPYGRRIEKKENLPALYREIGGRFRALNSWLAYMITTYENAEKYMRRKAGKNCKIYNGMMKTYFYQFLGPRPSRRKAGDGIET